MTGFGRGVAERGGVRATVDIRAVNHRFLDLKLRGEPVAPATEDAIGARVRGAIERGSVVIAIHLARESDARSRIDEAAARAAHAQLSALAKQLGTAPPELGLVLAQPGVVAAAEATRDSDAPAILAALDPALVELARMRAAEGGTLARELAARVAELATLRENIARLAAGLPEQLGRRLHERLGRLVRDEADQRNADAAGFLDPARLAQEVALLADRADVTEELVRLASHLDQVRALLAGDEPPASPGEAIDRPRSTKSGGVGRRLDFLAQELGRELNTIGSKSASAEITASVVEAKAVLEKLREQVQNVE
ncbi:MAG TPA: DUF1732 domain-containing protein [Kofleriaceae bacterium]|nr:DUF1732 domain-containing protein [Kofleriaceae bacterium]